MFALWGIELLRQEYSLGQAELYIARIQVGL